jgi:hypothetical protein
MPFSISRLLSSRETDIGQRALARGMINVLIWKKACINLFITYFNIELKRTKLTSHTDTKLMDMGDRYRLRVLLPKCQQIFPCWTSTFSKWQLTVGRKWHHGAHERLDIVLSEFCPDGRYRCGTCKIDVTTYKYVINTYISLNKPTYNNLIFLSFYWVLNFNGFKVATNCNTLIIKS